MELATFAELIGSLGFPIALVVAMGWFVYKLWIQSKDREDRLMTFIESYAGKLDVIESDLKEIKQDLNNMVVKQ